MDIRRSFRPTAVIPRSLALHSTCSIRLAAQEHSTVGFERAGREGLNALITGLRRPDRMV